MRKSGLPPVVDKYENLDSGHAAKRHVPSREAVLCEPQQRFLEACPLRVLLPLKKIKENRRVGKRAGTD